MLLNVVEETEFKTVSCRSSRKHDNLREEGGLLIDHVFIFRITTFYNLLKETFAFGA